MNDGKKRKKCSGMTFEVSEMDHETLGVGATLDYVFFDILEDLMFIFHFFMFFSFIELGLAAPVN